MCRTRKLSAVLAFTVLNAWMQVRVEDLDCVCSIQETPACYLLFFGERRVSCRVFPCSASVLIERASVIADAIAGVVGTVQDRLLGLPEGEFSSRK